MDAPLTEPEIAAALDPWADRGPILIAVSGGPDSLCLLRAAARWRARRHDPLLLFAATVDHGLRAGSADEAVEVEAWATSLGIPHAVLRWTGRKPRAGIQAAAREARYALLEAHAAIVGARVLMTAHHADDQAETVLMRLLRGSGIHGLSGMPALRQRGGGLLHVRPFLAWPKARLVATLAAEGMPWIEDPSNRDVRFGRTTMRTLLPLLEEHGFGRERLLALGRRARRADEALDQAAAAALGLDAGRGEGGEVVLAPAFLQRPEEIVVRGFVQLLVSEDGARRGGPPVRLERIEALVAALREARAEGRALRRTIAGHVVSLDRGGAVSLRREAPRQRGRGATPSRSAFTSRKVPVE